MAIDTTRQRSRRALLTAAVGGIGAAPTASVTKVAPAIAANGNPLLLGQTSFSSGTTAIVNNNGGSAFQASGRSTAIGASLYNGTALCSDASGPQGIALKTRYGRVSFEKVSGVAVIPKGRTSVAVQLGTDVNGRPMDVNGKTFVLLTPMTNIGSRGIWFAKQPALDRFVIRISAARGGPTRIAWLALETG